MSKTDVFHVSRCREADTSHHCRGFAITAIIAVVVRCLPLGVLLIFATVVRKASPWFRPAEAEVGCASGASPSQWERSQNRGWQDALRLPEVHHRLGHR